MRGIDYRDKDGKRIPLYVDFTRFEVNSQAVFRNSRPVWHDTPIHYKKYVEDGEIIDVSLYWEPHGYPREEMVAMMFGDTL